MYTCNSNLVPNTSAVYFISTYTNDYTVILGNFSRMREQIAPGRFSSQKNGLGPRLKPHPFRARTRGITRGTRVALILTRGFS